MTDRKDANVTHLAPIMLEVRAGLDALGGVLPELLEALRAHTRALEAHTEALEFHANTIDEDAARKATGRREV